MKYICIPHVHLRGATLTLDPCIPSKWRGFGMVFRYCSACDRIEVVNPRGVCRGVTSTKLDGRALRGTSSNIPLVDDGKQHHVAIELG
jgi:cyclic beta-1,2-glucan synthetase